MGNDEINKFKCEGECGEEKLLTTLHFYFKPDRNAFDKTCIECRKTKRRERHGSSKENNSEINTQPSNTESSSQQATENNSTEAEITGKEEILEVFKLLKQWRDELQVIDPKLFNEKWKGVDDV